MAKITPINEAEAIIAPFFDYNIPTMKEFQLIEEGAQGGSMKHDWDSCCITSPAHVFRVVWNGRLEIEGYDSIRLFIQYSSNLRLSGKAVVNGCSVKLFENIAPGTAPIEPTGFISESCSDKWMLTSYELEFKSVDHSNMDGRVTLYWVGLLSSKREYIIEEAIPKYSSEWEGFLNPSGCAGVKKNLFFSSDELQKLKEMLHLPVNRSIMENIIARAEKWDGFEPEKEIREYLPCAEGMYRFVRVRDRNRQVLEECMVELAITGWLIDKHEWSKLAARMVLSAVKTPKWFEGPVCCFPDSDFHHVCFTEDHYLSAVVMTLGFLGNILTKPAIDLVMNKIEEAWKWVNFKCTEKGYRYFMNQGVVGCRGRIMGASALWQYKGKYGEMIEESYKLHSEIISNYLNEEGHCPEGPNYYAYSFTTSIYVWILYSKYMGVPIESVLPESFKESTDYVRILLSTRDTDRGCIPLNCGTGNLPALLLLFLTRFCGLEEVGGTTVNNLRSNIKDNLSIVDILYILYWSQECSTLHDTNRGVISQLKSGLASYIFNPPSKGKLWLLCERNPFTGHFHEDRGSIVLEACGKILLPDLGTTSYSNMTSQYMHLVEYHNTVYPDGIKPLIASPLAKKEAAKAGHNIDTPLTVDMLKVPEAKILEFKENENGVDFAVDLSPIYECAEYAVRTGSLHVMENSGVLELLDHWKFDASRSLCANFISYYPWKIGENYAKGCGEGVIMEMYFDSQYNLFLYQDDFMVDCNGRKVYVLRVKTEKKNEVLLNTLLKYYINME